MVACQKDGTRLNRSVRFSLMVVLLLYIPSQALGMQQHIRFERISVDQGLSHAQVTAITQDQSGFMWIGTQDGLNRYDGYDFEVYRHDPNDPSSLSDNEIRGIAEDRFGNLWVGTRTGLNRLNRGARTFTRYSHDPDDETSISDNDITALLVDHEAVLWVGTRNGGLNRFDRSSESFERFQYDRENLVEGIKQGPIATIYEDRYNILWIATRDHNYGSLSHFDRKTDTFVPHFGCAYAEHGDCTIQHTGDEHRPIGTDINGLYQDASDAFWLATDSGAIQNHNGWLSPYKKIHGDLKSISDDRVLAPLQDQSGMLWFATKGGGLNRMGPPKPVNWATPDGMRQWHQVPDDPTWNAVFDRYQHDAADPYSLSSDNLTVLYEDRFGVIWIGTSDAGLNKFSPAGMRFGFYKHEPANPDSLSDNFVGAIAWDRTGTVWMGTFKGNLTRIDPASGKMHQFRHREGDPVSLPDSSIHALFVDKNDDLWIGTYSGLSKFDKTNNTFRNYNVHPVGPNVLGVLSIAEEPAGILWLGTQATLTRFDIASEEFKHFWPDPTIETSLHGDIFDVVTVDRNKQIWIATINAGVNKFDPVTETVVHLRHDPNDPNSISDDHVTSIYEDAYGPGTEGGSIMWFGTRSGLDRFDQNSNTFVNYNKASGLPGNYVSGAAPDGLGNLWISTGYSGLSRLDLHAGTFENFDVLDGLQGNRFFDHAFGGDSHGNMIVSGYNGINVFEEGKIIELNETPALVVTKFQAGGSLMSVDGNSNEIALPGHESELSFQFAALNFANPSRTRYSYKLDGYDNDWIMTDASNRVASYHNITPGEYTFRVRARLGNGDWGEKNVSLNLSIPRPMWQTNWAYVSYGLLLMMSVYLLMNMRSNALRRRAEVLEDSVAERTRQIEQNERLIHHQADHLEELLQVKEKLFTNISHEFRTPLTLILGPIERMLRQAKDSRTASQLKMVKENSQRLLRLVDQLLGLSRLSAEEPVTQSAQPLLPMVKTIVDSFQPLAEEKRIQLDLVDGEDLWVDCAPDALEKILLNLVSNAIKYTPDGGWVNVRVASAGTKMVRLSVSDSGIGIDRKDHQAVFERFYRVNGGESAPGAGLGLALVKELAEAFGGSVELESRPGLGTTISVLLSRHRVTPSDIETQPEKADTGLIPLEIVASAQSSKSVETARIDKSNGEASLLIVEDNVDMQGYLVSLLSDSYQCQVAADGEEGVKNALENIPDLVLCDVMLPKMDGFAVSKTLKTNAATSHIPIVMLTGRGDHDSRLKGLREHVDDYLTKPFDDEELTLRIANLLSARDALRRRYSRQLFDGSDVGHDLGHREQQFLDKLQAVLESNHSNSDFRVDQLSTAMAMSDRQLQRKLKALIDHSPAEYLRNYRLTMALKKLREGTQVGLVAEAVGFSSQAYFASCFKAEFNKTPSEFQQGLN
ncbi:MAG: ATP-binding protein [Gammaproteobacteria bacterium]|nr:ATP-binding protein [Gammaproteobacteria bacterium]